MSQAIRLHFNFKEDKVFLRSARKLTKRAPAGDSDFKRKMSEKGTGNWVELRDAKGRVLYRKLLRSIIPHEIEVRAKDPRHPLRRLKGRFKSGSFSILVPHMEGAKRLVLIERMSGGRDKKTDTVEHAQIDLNELEFEANDRRLEQ